MTLRLSPRLAVPLLLLTLLCPPRSARGDVSVERFNKSGGIQGIGASESAVVEKISGLKKHETTSMKMTGSVGGFLGKITGDMGSDVVTDIDKDVVRTLDHKKKTYTERPITLPKEKEEPPGQTEKAKEEKSKVRVVRNEISVKDTGEKKAINGFDCKRYVVTWLIETENVETKERTKTIMTNDLWNTAETKEIRALQKEELDFAQAYVKRLGLSVSPEDARKFGMTAVAGLFGQDEQAVRKKLKELQEEMAKIKGYPIVTALRWEVELPEGARQAGGEKAKEKPESVDLSGGIGGLLGGLAKMTAKKKTAESAKEGERNAKVLFDFYSEVRKIDVSPIPSSDFEAPSGYKLLK